VKKLTPEEVIKLSEALNGTCNDVNDGLRLIGLDPEEYDSADVAAQLEDVELCEQCGWWDESSEFDESNGESVCADCRETV
jgi:hypothetical protein